MQIQVLSFPGGQVIQDHHTRPSFKTGLHKMRADKAGAAGNQVFRHIELFSFYQIP
jgi:hypothetical protein